MNSNAKLQQLMTNWNKLSEEDQHALLSFAQFLIHRQTEPHVEEPIVPQEPLVIARPLNETAVQALKRLKKTYPMIDTDHSLLGEASGILMEKVMGRADAVIIERLETLFWDRYEKWRDRNKVAR